MTAPQIGVIGAPDIAHTLASLGFDIITADGFREAATAISYALKDGAFPLIVANNGEPVMAPWTTVNATKASTMIILDTAASLVLLPDLPDAHLALPATFNDLLAKLGYAGAPDPLGSKVIAVDTSLHDQAPMAAVPAPLPVAVAVAEPDPEPIPAPIVEPAPVEVAPDPAVAPAPVIEPVTQGPVFGAPSAPAPVFGGVPEVTAEPAAPVTPSAPVFGAPAVTPAPMMVPDVAAGPPAPAPVFGAPAAGPVFGVAEPAPVAPVAPAAPFGGYIAPAAEAYEQTYPVATQVAAPEPAPAPAQPVSPAFQPEPVYVPPVAAPAPAAQPWDALISGQPAPAPQQVAPQPPVTVQQPAAPVEQPVERARPNVRMGTKRGEIIFSAAGKGGVGKTSSAILLAECAAQQGLQAILIDANRGQADIRKYLRLGDADLRSAYDAYQHGTPAAALLKPADYAHLRTAAKLEVPDYGIVLGPPSDLAGSRYASAAIYGDIIDWCRSIADLVIVDTQIMEAPEERTDLWRETIIPMLGGDAWLLAITDESAAGIDNLHERLNEFRREGVSSARTLVLASQFLEFGADEIDYFQKKFNGLGSFVGNTGVDDEFAVQLNLGKVNSSSPSVRPAIDNVLLRTTNRTDLFSPRDHAPAGRGRPAGKFGLFGKKRSA